MKPLNFTIEKGKLIVVLDADLDGKPSLKLELDFSESIDEVIELFKKDREANK